MADLLVREDRSGIWRRAGLALLILLAAATWVWQWDVRTSEIAPVDPAIAEAK